MHEADLNDVLVNLSALMKISHTTGYEVDSQPLTDTEAMALIDSLISNVIISLGGNYLKFVQDYRKYISKQSMLERKLIEEIVRNYRRMGL